MRLAIITEAGEAPIASEELAREIEKRLSPVARLVAGGSLRKAIVSLEMDIKQRTVTLGPEHR